jgi:hypothetical protein
MPDIPSAEGVVVGGAVVVWWLVAGWALGAVVRPIANPPQVTAATAKLATRTTGTRVVRVSQTRAVELVASRGGGSDAGVAGVFDISTGSVQPVEESLKAAAAHGNCGLSDPLAEPRWPRRRSRTLDAPDEGYQRSGGDARTSLLRIGVTELASNSCHCRAWEWSRRRKGRAVGLIDTAKPCRPRPRASVLKCRSVVKQAVGNGEEHQVRLPGGSGCQFGTAPSRWCESLAWKVETWRHGRPACCATKPMRLELDQGAGKRHPAGINEWMQLASDGCC